MKTREVLAFRLSFYGPKSLAVKIADGDKTLSCESRDAGDAVVVAAGARR